jgi:hypothetical protein
MSVPAWQVLAGLPAWQVTQIPRPALPDADTTAGSTAPGKTAAASGDAGRGQRMMALASAARSDRRRRSAGSAAPAAAR